ncbi:hypothetical protein [Piscibacillus salipiscarius]|uniref:Uncharacterized protein n=1 Tax=Piscibacillus salipiscarius TaxID=299480 RepID=A0ABW5Q6V8_9BACI|nr:hypothetical protein [Piscibacillus salipiscarius]
MWQKEGPGIYKVLGTGMTEKEVMAMSERTDKRIEEARRKLNDKAS